ncbi:MULTISPECIES: gas vesicle protein GvpG [unclassified Streptomyces]|uniref:gas vesicle protein GvpG n=1 Tax=unclassified Streptomyces TaxID=2593676 RepID=UPI0004BFA13F|nr:MULTISPECIES: gas vesicle protein GvpG [unclassified Streptomyces]
MGLFSALLTAPLAPVRGVAWVADQLAEAADREVNDPAAVRARLAALNQALEDGEIDLAAFEREEDRLLDRLEARPGPEVTR